MCCRSGGCGLLALLLLGTVLVVASAPSGAMGQSRTLGLEIVSGPSGTVAERKATFTFRARDKSVFLCRVDDRKLEPCDSGTVTYADLTDGTHTFTVVAELATDDAVTEDASRTWIIAVPPDTRIESGPTGTVRTTRAVFTFSAIPSATGFDCSLDQADFTPCASPQTYSDLARTAHTFAVRAITEVGADPTPATASWQIQPLTTPAPDTRLVSAPGGTVTTPSATFVFASDPLGVTFECSLDDGTYVPCSSPFSTAPLQRGQHRFAVRAISSGRRDETPARAAWTLAAVAGGGAGDENGGWILPAAIAAAALLGSVALSLTARVRFRGRRLEWELEATEEEPHGPCRAGRHIQKELTLKPARRTIVHLDLEARDQGDGTLARRVEGEPVDGLNAAVRTYRRNRNGSAELRLALLPVSRQLANQIETWLAREAEARRDVSMRAYLQGGKAEWTFTPWKCVRGRWRKGRQWKVEVEDERDEPVAVLSHPYPVAVSAEVLLSQLSLFVAEVDVRETQRPPERAPILHG
jgi:hypothetical protein